MPAAETFEFKAISGQIDVDEAQGIVECFVAGIGNKDSVGDVVLPGAFTESLKRRKPRVVWGHDWNHPIGKVLDIYEVGPNDPRLPMKMRKAGIGGLFAKVQFNLKSEKGREAFTNVSFFGEDQEWSIGYKTLDAYFDGARKANMLKEVELYEVSPVLHGANQLTATISIKSDEQEKSGKPLKDPKGGLTAAGREFFKRTEGANLKPGVRGPANTPEKMRRKGSFLTRFFTNPSGPMKDDSGEATRLALSAAAWGEPVPQNADDAAELAAKGRRLLERYNKVKEKGFTDGKPVSDIYDSDDDYVGPRGEDGGVPATNPSMGRAANLARALSTRFGGNIRLRVAQDNLAVFDHIENGNAEILRVTYHFDGDEFMFGEPERVRTETVYLPADGEGDGQAYESDDQDEFDDTDEKFIEIMKLVAQKMREARNSQQNDMKSLDNEIEIKAGRVLNRNNIGKLRQAIELLQEVMATGGTLDIEMKKKSEIYVPVEITDIFSVKSTFDEICSIHGLNAKALDDGIVISGDFSEIAEDEILAAMEEYAVKVRPEAFDPNAIDADADGVVQEGTPFKRPATPKLPSAMESAQKLNKAIDDYGHTLTSEERRLIRFRSVRSLDDAAKEFGGTRESVRQREQKIMKKLRDASWTAKPQSSPDKIKMMVEDYGSSLSKDDRELLIFRAENSLDAAAQKFGGTRESIRQREAKAMMTMRNAATGQANKPSPNMPSNRTDLRSQTSKPSIPSAPDKPKSKKVEVNLSTVRGLTSSKFDPEREFGDFNRRFQKHTVDGSMGKSDIVSMDRMYQNLTKKAKAEGIDANMFKGMSSSELEDFFQAIAFGKMEPDTRAEFLAMLMADFELGMRKISKDRRKNGPQGSFEPKIEVDKILQQMASRMDK